MPSFLAAFPGDEGFFRMRLRWFDVARDQSGTALVEFTFVLPVVLFLLLGMLQFGIIFYNYVLVTRATEIGVRTLSISRLDPNAYTHVEATINQAATNISGLTIAMSVNGTACSSNSGCQTALQSAHNAFAVPPQPVSVTVSYSCSSTSIMPADLINLTGICPLTSTMYASVE
jgi:Flp pilus assembly protein TadG